MLYVLQMNTITKVNFCIQTESDQAFIGAFQSWSRTVWCTSYKDTLAKVQFSRTDVKFEQYKFDLYNWFKGVEFLVVNIYFITIISLS